MNKVIEHVAQSIFAEERPDDSYEKFVANNRNPQKYVRIARAAVEAMRDPSQGMRIVGHAALVESEACVPDLGHQIGLAALGDAWRAMIDAALEPSQIPAQQERFGEKST